MRIFYDTEFHETGGLRPIELISIGMVADDGREYYAINRSATWWAIWKDEWLRDNVLSQLPGKILNHGNGGGGFEPDESTGLFKPLAQIRDEVSVFCYPPGFSTEKKRAELWGYYSAYDHVLLCSLFGRMIDLPAHMPMYTRDLQQFVDTFPRFDLDLPKQEGGEHNALEDARWTMTAFKAVTD